MEGVMGLEDRSRILVVGIGGIGCPAALALARPGRTLGLVDPDRVEPSNLHRQILYDDGDVGEPKVAAAARRLLDAVPGLRVETFHGRFEVGEAERTAARWDVLLDGTDDVRCKFLVSDAAVRTGRPAVVGGALRLEGTIVSVVPGTGACYRCLFEHPPDPDDLPTCAQAGILGPVAGVVAGLAAGEVEAALSGSPRAGIAAYDAGSGAVRRIVAPPLRSCPACGASRPPLRELPGNATPAGACPAAPDAAAPRMRPARGSLGGLTADEIERYGRQILLREVGGAGQRRIRAASIDVPGADALSEVRRTYLRAAGVGAVTGPPRTLTTPWDPASLVEGCRAAAEDLLRIAAGSE